MKFNYFFRGFYDNIKDKLPFINLLVSGTGLILQCKTFSFYNKQSIKYENTNHINHTKNDSLSTPLYK